MNDVQLDDVISDMLEAPGDYAAAMQHARDILREAIRPKWQLIVLAPRDGTFVLVAGSSGYTSTRLRVEVCRYDSEGRGWRNHAHDWFTDGGPEATLWMPLPEL